MREPDRIKLDLHIHTLDDPKDKLDYSAHELLARARRLGFSALAITLHDEVFDRPKVFADADRRTGNACPQPSSEKFKENNNENEGNDGNDGEDDKDEWFHGSTLAKVIPAEKPKAKFCGGVGPGAM